MAAANEKISWVRAYIQGASRVLNTLDLGRAPRIFSSIERHSIRGRLFGRLCDRRKNDAGKIETCEYVKSCEIEPVGFGLSIFLSFMHSDHRSVDIEVYGRQRGCCYSADATRTIYLNLSRVCCACRFMKAGSEEATSLFGTRSSACCTWNLRICGGPNSLRI
jgi:hypothetical protein